MLNTKFISNLRADFTDDSKNAHIDLRGEERQGLGYRLHILFLT